MHFISFHRQFHIQFTQFTNYVVHHMANGTQQIRICTCACMRKVTYTHTYSEFSIFFIPWFSHINMLALVAEALKASIQILMSLFYPIWRISSKPIHMFALCSITITISYITVYANNIMYYDGFTLVKWITLVAFSFWPFLSDCAQKLLTDKMRWKATIGFDAWANRNRFEVVKEKANLSITSPYHSSSLHLNHNADLSSIFQFRLHLWLSMCVCV